MSQEISGTIHFYKGIFSCFSILKNQPGADGHWEDPSSWPIRHQFKLLLMNSKQDLINSGLSYYPAHAVFSESATYIGINIILAHLYVEDIDRSTKDLE